MENKNFSPVPAGYSYSEGNIESGYTIKRDHDGSELVWVPVANLKADGRFGATDSSFGTRGFGYSGSTAATPSDVLSAQAESVKKYGGFYITKYCLSSGKDGALQSVKGAVPITNINRVEAVRAARGFEEKGEISSHLPFAAEMDSALSWLIDSGLKTEAEIEKRVNIRSTRAHTEKIAENGSDESLFSNGIYDLAGVIDEWTQDLTDGAYLWGCNPCAWPGSSRCYFAPYPCYSYCGFRAVLYIK